MVPIYYTALRSSHFIPKYNSRLYICIIHQRKKYVYLFSCPQKIYTKRLGKVFSFICSFSHSSALSPVGCQGQSENRAYHMMTRRRNTIRRAPRRIHIQISRSYSSSFMCTRQLAHLYILIYVLVLESFVTIVVVTKFHRVAKKIYITSILLSILSRDLETISGLPARAR